MHLTHALIMLPEQFRILDVIEYFLLCLFMFMFMLCLQKIRETRVFLIVFRKTKVAVSSEPEISQKLIVPAFFLFQTKLHEQKLNLSEASEFRFQDDNNSWTTALR